MINKKVNLKRTEKKIKFIRKKNPARCNLNVALKKMITEVYGNAP